jgi:hypothetical protein
VHFLRRRIRCGPGNTLHACCLVEGDDFRTTHVQVDDELERLPLRCRSDDQIHDAPVKNADLSHLILVQSSFMMGMQGLSRS